MSFKKLSQVIFLILVLILSTSSNLFCQESQAKVKSKINVTMFSEEKGFSDLDNSVYNTLKQVLEENGLYSENDFNTELLIKAKKVDNDKIALSVVEMQALPKEAVEVGKKAEVFYSKLDADKKASLPEEGKFIREYMSAEYLKQFRSVWGNNLEIINLSDLEKFSRNLAAKYL